jgi:hypothetical protein
MSSFYPNDNEVKVQWTSFQKLVLILLTISLIVFLSFHWKAETITKILLLNSFGIYLNILGSVMSTLKTPFYGLFYDGGRLERVRQEVEAKYFKFGIMSMSIGAMLLLLGLA